MPSTLALRIIGIAVLVAMLVALIAGGVAITAVRRTALEANTAQLAQQADVVQGELTAAPTDSPGTASLLKVLADQGVLVVTFDGSRMTSGDATAVGVASATRLLRGAALPMSDTVRIAGKTWVVQARALPATSGDRGFALVTEADRGAVSARVLIRRTLIAMLIGLGVAIPAGLVLARVVSRPLRRTAVVANTMAAGRRDLRIKAGGPAEVREVADAVNRLADALAGSESRQQRFLAAVSHELRTPLAAVSGLADALSDDLVAPAEVGQVGATIRAEAARLERLVADLLDLARLGTADFVLDMQPTEVTEVLTSMARVWQVRCDQRSVSLLIRGLDQPAMVWADVRRLRQVLDGLAENALRVLQPGQGLVLEALAGVGDTVRIEVRDGGPGLTTDDYRVAFEPGVLHERYRQTRPSGAGLGLALAHGLVSRMGGTLTAGPAPEGGVCAAITLRRAAAQESPGSSWISVPGSTGWAP